jgi:hypothetical protein
MLSPELLKAVDPEQAKEQVMVKGVLGRLKEIWAIPGVRQDYESWLKSGKETIKWQL